METDHTETRNLAGRHHDRVRAMAFRWDEIARATDVYPLMPEVPRPGVRRAGSQIRVIVTKPRPRETHSVTDTSDLWGTKREEKHGRVA